MRELALKLTSHVGRDLLASATAFKTEEAVVWEYVVNSLQYVDDGVAPKVNVLVVPREKRIEISDNGRGMTDADLRIFFTMHAKNIDRLRGRVGRGKFGTGKSAAFGIARMLTVDTRRNGVRNKVVLNREAVDASTGDDIPVEWVIRNEATTLPNGTTVGIERIELSRLLTAPIIEYIERHLQFFRALVPEVAVNDHVCQFREPEIAEVLEFRPTAEQAKVLGDVLLRVKLSRGPLPQSEVGIAVTAGIGALVAIETGGIEGKEFGNYLFGEIECPAIEQTKSSIEPYDPTRNLQLNIRHPVCATLIPFIASKLEEVRAAQVRRLQEARKSEQARRLEQEANRIAEVLNQDFEAVVSRLDGIRAASASASRAVGRFGAKGNAGDDVTSYVEGIQVPADVETADSLRPGGKGFAGRNPPDLARRATPRSDGGSAADAAGGEGQRKRPRGGFRVAYRPLGEREYRSRYDPSTLTILINLDHPAVKNALTAGSGSTEDLGFRRLSYELAFTEYSLALGYEMANRDPEVPADDLLYEIRASLNRVSVAAASLYSLRKL
jgi:Histidine kinase-, DNA gyrase B-, and HSP90-like ATPase